MQTFPVTPWCNGSTTGFGPVSLGSNPGGVAIFFPLLKLLSFKRVFYPVRQMIGAHLGHKWVTIADLRGTIKCRI